MTGDTAPRCCCGTDPAASPYRNWDSSCPHHGQLPVCPDCGHVHIGDAFASICVGCPCPTRPVRRHPARVQANADDYPDAAELHARTMRIWAMLPPDVREAYDNDPGRLT
jgi:hypothetical protein